jgi:hypothetical protein
MTPENKTPVRYELDTTTGHGDRSTEQHLVLDATDTWVAVCPDDPTAAALVAMVNELGALRKQVESLKRSVAARDEDDRDNDSWKQDVRGYHNY